MGAPLNDIGINPPRSNRTLSVGAVAAGTGIKYGMAVKADTSSDTNFRDVLVTAAGDVGVLGIVQDKGDPNASNAFAVGDELGVCVSGYAEALLDAGATATKGAPCICATTAGTIGPVGGAAPYDLVGTFAQDYDNSAGASPVLISIKVGVYRRFS